MEPPHADERAMGERVKTSLTVDCRVTAGFSGVDGVLALERRWGQRVGARVDLGSAQIVFPIQSPRAVPSRWALRD